MLIFDEYNEWFRSPQGALKTGETLRLRMLAERGKCSEIRIALRPEGGAEKKSSMKFAGNLGRYEIFEGEIAPEAPNLYWFHFEADEHGKTLSYDVGGPGHASHAPFQITVSHADILSPDWISGGIMYHIFIDRFNRAGETQVREGSVLCDDWGGMPVFRPDEKGIIRNNDFFGGNLQGIIEKLPMLADLGVSCIYLSPVFEAASNHKYDTGDYFKIDSSFGDEETFKRLIEEAAKLGMRIICDGVFNHVGEDSRYFDRYSRYGGKGAYQSPNSPYYSWFNWKEWPESYESWWGIKLLPSTNKRDEGFKSFITGVGGVLDYWMKCGVAGWRLDVVDELPDEFLYPLCEAVKRHDPNALIIGEVWEDASNKIAYGRRRRYLLGDQLDGVMNYPLKDAIISYVRDGNAEAVAATMQWLGQNYPKAVLDANMNILGTHDTARILTALGSEGLPENREEMSRYRLSEQQRRNGVWRLKIASALQFALPGVPCVYYGDEAGMEGCADPFNRYCYPWGTEDAEIYEWYRTLGRVRRSLSAFRGGAYELLKAGGGIFVFRRGEGDGAVIVAVNVSDRPYKLQMPGPMLDHLTGNYQWEPLVPEHGAVILTP